MRFLLALSIVVLLFSACSNTWKGVKEDSKSAGQWTKEKVNAGATWVKEKTE